MLLAAMLGGACVQDPAPVRDGSRITLFRLSGQPHSPCPAVADSGSILCSPPKADPQTASPAPRISWGSGHRTRAFELSRQLARAGSSQTVGRRLLSHLERRVSQEPENPEHLNDLAVARWFLAEKRGSHGDLPVALADFERARSLGSPSQSLLFNQAVWLTIFGLRNPARERWQQFLDRESDPAWRQEALESLRSLDDVQTSELRKDISNHVLQGDPSSALRTEPQALPQLLRELSQGREIPLFLGTDPSTRARAKRLSQALESVDGSPFFAHTLRAFKALAPGEQAVFVEAHKQFADGFESFERGDLNVAEARWSQAEAVLDRFRSPFRFRLDILLSILDYYEGHFDKAYGSLTSLLRSSELEPYPALQARCHWLMALCRGKRGDLLKGSKHLKRSIELYGAAGEPGHEAAARSLLAETTQELGDRRRAWRYRLQAMARLDQVPDPRRRHNMLYEAADGFFSENLPALALPFLDQMVKEAEQLADPIFAIEARIWHARALGRSGSSDTATQVLRPIEPKLADLPPGGLTDRLKADVEWIRGTLADLPYPEALRRLDAAEELYARSGDRTRLPALLRDRAAVHPRTRVDLAVSDLLRGIEVFEDLRKNLPEKDLRISYFDRSRELFDELIPLLLDAGESRQALFIAERSKARVLKDLLASERAAEPTEVENHLDARSAVLFFFVLDDELLLWVQKHRATELFRLPNRHREIGRLVAQLAAIGEAGGRPDPRFNQALDRLSELTIAPIADQLRQVENLVIVPDKDLFRIPFDSLLRDGRHLFQDVRVTVVPSFSLWLQAKTPVRLPTTPPRSLLTVAITEFDPDSNLRPLPGAGREAREVSEHYGEPVMLLDDQGTLEAFRSGLQRAEVLHLATHAVVNAEYPLFSFVALSSGGATEPVYVHQLYDLPLGRLRFAVLAACRTGVGQISLTEGPHSLARPFLAQGVPSVLATLWNIDDASSAEILSELHRYVASGVPPAEALRRTKSDFFGNFGSGSVQSIATFQMLGAG